MKIKMNFIVLLTGVLSVSFFQACSFLKKKEKPFNNIICFVDFSDAENKDERLSFYSSVISNSIINKMHFDDQLLILPIDKNSITNGVELFKYKFKKETDYIPDGTSPIEEEKIAESNLRNEKDSILPIFKQAFQSIVNNRVNDKAGTDIINALSQVKRYNADGQHNMLILLSDMMNWSDNLKMEDLSFDKSTADLALNKFSVAELKNVDVIVLTGQVKNSSADHFVTVKYFWESYFKKSGANLKDYSSNAISVLESQINWSK